MKKTFLYSFLILVLALAGFTSRAQDTIRSLVITEFTNVHISRAYVELTNMGADTLNLSDFSGKVVKSGNTNLTWDGTQLRSTEAGFVHLPDVKLAPGKSWTFMNVRDNVFNGYPNHVVKYVPIADYFGHIADAGIINTYLYKPEWEIWGRDSIDAGSMLGGLFQGDPGNGFVLQYHFMGGTQDSMYADSAIVDGVNLGFDPTDYDKFSSAYSDLAGIPAASTTHIFVRKYNVTKGNVNWELGKGTSLETSEWIPMPVFGTQSAFTTFGNHGNYDISMQSDLMDINLADTIITIPWGNGRRGDDIIDRMTIGDGMSWYYVQNENSDDSAKVTTCNGDVLEIYAMGEERKNMNFKIVTAEPEASMAKVFPLLSRNINNLWSGPRYTVTDDVPVIDSILNVPFAERIDTLLKYLDKAPKANWEIVYVDGQNRIDLKNGDKLKVTAEDGSTVKEYYIGVEDYVKSENSSLSSITWPDIPEYIPGWLGDTIPGFSPAAYNYVVTLPYGTTQVPALVAKAQNLNATIIQNRATSLTGGFEQRTTSFTVISQAGSMDTLFSKYAVTFEVEKDPAKIQNYYGEPFFTEMLTLVYSHKYGLQMVNPRSVELDMSRYMIVRSLAATGVNPAQAIQACITTTPTIANHNQRYTYCYVPGYQFTEDTAAWILEPGKLSIDPDVDPVVKPLGTFSVGACNLNRSMYDVDLAVNKWWYSGTNEQFTNTPTVNPNNTVAYLKRNTEALMLFKILNDSILNGTKQIGDPADFELVDIFGDATIDGIWPIAGTDVAATTRTQIVRKPSSIMGSTTPGYGFGNTPDSSEWVVESYLQNTAFQIMGHHPMDPITIHLSTVASTVYLMSDGFSANETVQGDMSSTTVEQFLNNIIKSDTGQVLTVMRGEAALASTDAVATSDVLKVVSSNGENETRYILNNTALDSDATLTLVGSNTGLTINSDDETISGVTYGMLLSDLLMKIKAPDLASMNVIDNNGNLVPLKILDADTMLVDTKVGGNMIIEVVAQDGLNKKMYKLVPTSTSSEAYIISSLYNVDEITKLVSNIPFGVTRDVLFTNIEAVKGATMTLCDKAGFERTEGTIQFDDYIKVVSEDGSKIMKYLLTFLTEENPDLGTGLVKQVAFDSSNLKVYPVPANNEMTIKLANQDVKQFTLSLISITGSCVYKEVVTGDSRKLDVQQFKSGAYIVSVNLNGATLNKLVIINP